MESNALLNKFNTATCENMICVTTAFQIGNVMLPNKGILDEYAKLGNVYCTSGLYSRNKTYGIVKSIFEFDKNCPVANAYEKFAKEVLSNNVRVKTKNENTYNR